MTLFLLRFSLRNTASHSCQSLPLGAARGRSEERTSTQKVLAPPSFCACAPRGLRRKGSAPAHFSFLKPQAQNPGPSKIFPLQRA